MSDINPNRMIPLHIADQAVAACEAEIQKLREENARLRKAGDAAFYVLATKKLSPEAWKKLLDEWNAAKDGKPSV